MTLREVTLQFVRFSTQKKEYKKSLSVKLKGLKDVGDEGFEPPTPCL